MYDYYGFDILLPYFIKIKQHETKTTKKFTYNKKEFDNINELNDELKSNGMSLFACCYCRTLIIDFDDNNKDGNDYFDYNIQIKKHIIDKKHKLSSSISLDDKIIYICKYCNEYTLTEHFHCEACNHDDMNNREFFDSLNSYKYHCKWFHNKEWFDKPCNFTNICGGYKWKFDVNHCIIKEKLKSLYY
jgi:hypothetical protein